MGDPKDDTSNEYWPNGTLKTQKAKPAGPAKVTETATSGATTAGKDLGSKEKGGEGAPKQKDGESASSFAERYRKWREEQKADPAIAGQKKAIQNMRGSKK